MLYEELIKEFNNSSDLKVVTLKKATIIYLESICSSDKINDYILKTLSLKKEYISLKDTISSPSIVFITDNKQISFYLLNGYALVYDDKETIVCEVKGDLYRGVDFPSTESSINGPKDSFNENIVMNLGLIKRRIKDNNLINKDYFLGKTTKTKVSILYLKGIAKESLISKVNKKLKNINTDSIINIENLSNLLYNDNFPLPRIVKTERPDRVSQSLLEGKIAIIADNSPFALIIPGFFVDFINPEGDNYGKAININFLKILRLLCLFLTLSLPAVYISIINYNPETVPLKMLLAFQAGRIGVPFPSAIEALIMILLCSILKESDIRFPTNYGSSISIVGALILGEAAVSANIVSPIMIIIIGITFITGLIFNNGDMIDGLRYYRLTLLLLAIFLGLYGLVLGWFFITYQLCDTKTFGINYMYPIAPFDKTYFFKTILKGKKNSKRSKILSSKENKEASWKKY